MATFNVTFERVTPESAEYGDAESRGFIIENASLRDAVKLLGSGSYIEADCCPVRSPRWFTAYETNGGTRDFYETGATENRSLHLPESLTEATRQRIARYLGCYGVR